MRFLLDTNAVIGLMKGHPAILGQVRRVGRRELCICATVESELWFGVSRSTRVTENTERLLRLLTWVPSIPFAGEATRRFGEIRAHLARQGRPIGPYDLQIAATATAADMILVTNNRAEFERVPNLRIEDWTLSWT